MSRLGSIWWFGALVLLGLGVVWFAQPTPVDSREASAAAPAEVELDADKQKRIWDLEHMSFVLETHFGKPFVKVLRQRRAEKLATTYFREDFRGELPEAGGWSTRRAGPVSEMRRNARDAGFRQVDAAAAARHLIGYLDGFGRIDRIRLAVTHIERPEADRWETDLLLMAAGAGDDEAPVEHVSRHHAEFRFADEEEVKTGRVLASLRVASETRRTSPRDVMQEVTEKVGFAELPLQDNWNLPRRHLKAYRYHIAVADYDVDGYLDILVASTDGRPLLLHSKKGRRFELVTESMGIRPAADPHRDINALVGWIDYDNDGFPDLLLGSRLYHNDGGRRFVDVSQASGLKFDRVPFGCAVADYDGDGLLDLYIVYQKGFQPRPPGTRPWVGDPYAGAMNHLWRNRGGGRFENVTRATGAGGGRHQTFAAATFFFDHDPFPDLYLANDFGANVLLRNRGDGTFEDVTGVTGTGDYSTSMGVSAGDLDNDGTSELYVANMYSKMGRRIIAHVDEDDYPPGIHAMIKGSLAGNRLYRSRPGEARYEELSAELGINEVGWAHAPAMVDIDGDGWLDLYATAGYHSADREKPDG